MSHPLESTPLKSASSNTSSTYDLHPQETISQLEMKNTMREELQRHVYASPTFADKAFPDRFGVFDQVYPIVRKYQHSWGNGKSWQFPNEQSSYPAYVSLFEAIRKAFMGNLKIKANLNELYFRDIRFSEHDRPMGEKLNDSAGALKPDILATFRNTRMARVHWRDVEIVGEVKDDWAEMIAQCATYARCMFAAHENRRFCILFAANYVDNSIRIGTLTHAGLFLTPKLFMVRQEEDFMALVRAVVGILSVPPAGAGVDTSYCARFFMFENVLYKSDEVYAKHRSVVGRSTLVQKVSRYILEGGARDSWQGQLENNGAVPSFPKVGRPATRSQTTLAATSYQTAQSDSQPGNSTHARKTQSSSQIPTLAKTRSKSGSSKATSSFLSNQFSTLSLVNLVKHNGEEWNRVFVYDGTDCPFKLEGKFPEDKFREAVKGVDSFIVKDAYPLVDRVKEGDVLFAGEPEFGLPYILASYTVDDWTTEKLIDDADAVYDDVLAFKSDRGNRSQTTAGSVEGSRTSVNSVESNQRREKSGSEHSANTRGLAKSKIPQLVNPPTGRTLRSATKSKGSSGTTPSVDKLKGKSGAVGESAGKSVQGDASEPAKIDHRRHYRMLIRDIGLPLYKAETPSALLEALLHGMVGYMGIFRKEYLHRDVSIGNVLLLKEPVKREINSELCNIVPALEKWFPDSHCRGILIDGDQLIKYTDPSRIHAKERSGTLPFMSIQMTSAWVKGTSYLHTAFDDLESFLWVLIWTVLYIAEKRDELTDDEGAWFRTLQSGDYEKLQNKGSIIQKLADEEWTSLSSPVSLFTDLCISWWQVRSKYRVRGYTGENPPAERCFEAFKEYMSAGHKCLNSLRDKGWEGSGRTVTQ